MIDETHSENHLTLHQLSMHVKDAIEGNFMQQIWVVAEIAAMNVNQSSGHCYLELVEKKDKTTLAKMRANIWSFKLQHLLNQFFQVTGNNLQAGMKSLLLTEVQYHPVYGISLNIVGIDPAYSLGDLARRKKEVEERLVKEGLIHKNKALDFPLVPQRIALVSSETAAGYEDFLNQLQNNKYGYCFSVKVFQALMQGEKSVSSIVGAIQKVESKSAQFDVVIIVRGGGSVVELSTFDEYELAKAIANCSLPVLTGIGHERDESIADLVAHKKLKTPTAVAEFLISTFNTFDEMLIDAKGRVKEVLQFRLEKEKKTIADASYVIERKSLSFVNEKKSELDKLKRDVSEFSNKFIEFKKRILFQSKSKIGIGAQKLIREKQFDIKDLFKQVRVSELNLINQKKHQIMLLEEKIKLLDPAKVIARGYTLTYSDGKVIKSVTDLQEGTEINTIFKDGEITSKII